MTARGWIWSALALQFAAFAWEGVWHGLLRPDFDATVTRESMARHLLTVHLPVYAAIAALLAASTWALVVRQRTGGSRAAPLVVLVFAIGQLVGQVWDAYAHLQLSHGGPIAWTLITLAPIVGVITMLVDARRERRRSAGETGVRRAA